MHVEVEAYPGQTFPGQITRVSPSVDVESRSFQVEASVPNPKGLLKPGFFAKASILVAAERNVPFVPEEAVASFAGIVKVYAIVDGKAEERRVKTGVRRDGRVEILEGVKVGETRCHLQPRPARHRHRGDRPNRASQRGSARQGRERPAGGIFWKNPETILGALEPAAHMTTPLAVQPSQAVSDTSHFTLESRFRSVSCEWT